MMHIKSAPNGSVVRFKNSALYFLKVSDVDNTDGVVEIGTGWFIPTGKIWEDIGCEPYVGVIADSLDVFYRRIYAEELY